MAVTFRPQVEYLDAREMPTVTPFNFTLSDGAYASGTFNYLDGSVDPNQASQRVAIFGLNFTVNGQPVLLEEAVTAPVALFTQGQLFGASFAYEVGGVAYDAIAVADSTAVAVTFAGNIFQGAATVVGAITPGAIPPAPEQFNPATLTMATAITKYNANAAGLATMLVRVKEKMAAYDGLFELLTDIRLKEVVAPPAEQPGWKAFGDAYYAKLTNVAASLFAYTADYQNRHAVVLAQQDAMEAIWNLGDLLVGGMNYPLGPAYVVPPGYFQSLDHLA
ncbi:MAG: hypothetical protein L0241_19310 [Planctomycetia bacterium]|nr:hypothetical protein [Planctomycetia bacterium]